MRNQKFEYEKKKHKLLKHGKLTNVEIPEDGQVMEAPNYDWLKSDQSEET